MNGTKTILYDIFKVLILAIIIIAGIYLLQLILINLCFIWFLYLYDQVLNDFFVVQQQVELYYLSNPTALSQLDTTISKWEVVFNIYDVLDVTRSLLRWLLENNVDNQYVIDEQTLNAMRSSLTLNILVLEHLVQPLLRY